MVLSSLIPVKKINRDHECSKTAVSKENDYGEKVWEQNEKIWTVIGSATEFFERNRNLRKTLAQETKDLSNNITNFLLECLMLT